MSHARSGLPPLDLEPFDPTPLYAAARSHRRDRHQPHHKGRRHPLLTLVTGVAAVAALTIGAFVAFVLI